MKTGTSRGHALVELIVVAVILGVLAAVTLPRLGDTDDARLSREARRLGRLLEIATQDALLTGRAVGVVFSPAGYVFRARGRDGRWADHPDGELRARTLGPGMRVEAVAVDGAPLEREALLMLAPAGDQPVYEVELAGPGGRARVGGNPVGNVRVARIP